MQGTQVRSLVQEDPTCHRATKPMHHNCWAQSRSYPARTPRACAPQREKPPSEKPTPSTEQSPLTKTRGKPKKQQRPNTAKNKQFFKKNKIVIFSRHPYPCSFFESTRWTNQKSIRQYFSRSFHNSPFLSLLTMPLLSVQALCWILGVFITDLTIYMIHLCVNYLFYVRLLGTDLVFYLHTSLTST